MCLFDPVVGYVVLYLLADFLVVSSVVVDSVVVVVVVVVDFLQIAEFFVVVHIVDLFLLDFVSDSIDIYNLFSY